jgi:SAM-dependent methyltransferase
MTARAGCDVITLDRETYMKRRYRRVQALVNRREQGLVRDLLRQIEPRPAKILDIPCGHGRFTAQFRAAASDSVVCSDLWQRHLDALAAAETPEGAPIVLRQADLLGRLPFEDREFDLVFDFRLYQHLAEPGKRRHVAGELVRVARRHLIVSYYRTPSLHAVQQVVRRVIRRRKYKVQFESATDFQKMFTDLGCRVRGEWGVLPLVHAQRVVWLDAPA